MDALLKKLRHRFSLSADEEGLLRGLGGEPADFAPRQTVVRRDELQRFSRLLVSGFAIRHKEASSGERQILEIHVPGDFVDLHSFPLKRLDHDVSALSACRFINVPHERMTALEGAHPRLIHILWHMTLVDGSIQREGMLTLSRRTAIARLAHIFCELHCRLEVVGLAENGAFALPFNQVDLAEFAGITSVHTSRMLRELREAGLVTFKGGEVRIHDMKGLAQLADFTPAYLYLGNQPA